MAAIQDFLKEQGKQFKSPLNVAFMPMMIKGVVDADNKLKALTKTTADWLVWSLKALAPLRTYIISGLLVKAFVGVGDAIKNIVRDTGSLHAALARMQSIQFSTAQLAPLIGGLGAAKQRIAELILLSAKGPFRFEEIAATNKQLEVFTRGAFSSIEATKLVGQVAIATGNNISDLGEAVSQLYQSLRGGGDIQGATENLRQMGILSDQAAGDLAKLAQSGATTTEVFGRFKESLEDTRRGMADMSNDLASVTEEHEKAAEAMKAAFGAPWTQSDINNTKNMTAAMQAITPVVGKISEGFSILFGGLDTFRSSIVRAAAETPILQKALLGLGYAFQAALAAALLFGTAGLVTLLPKISGIASSIGAYLIRPLEAAGLSFAAASRTALIFGGALRVVGFAVAGAGILTGLAAVVGTALSVKNSMDAAAKETEKMRTEFDKSARSIQAQLAGAKSLAERNEALAKSINLVTDAQSKLNQVSKDYHSSAMAKIVKFTSAVGISSPSDQRQMRMPIVQAKANVIRAKMVERQAFAESTAGLTSPQREAAMAQARERAMAMEEERFQQRAGVKTGVGKAKVLEERAGVLGERARVGAAGVEVKAQLGEEEARRTQEIGLAFPKKKEREEQLKTLQKEMLTKRAAAPEGTSVQLEAEAEKRRHAILAGAPGIQGPQKTREAEMAGNIAVARNEAERETLRLQIQQLQNAAATAKQYEEQTVALQQQSEQLKMQAQLEREQHKVTTIRAGSEYKISQLKGTSEEKARAEFEIRKKEQDELMTAEITRKGGPRPEAMAEIKARKDSLIVEEQNRRKTEEQAKVRVDAENKIANLKGTSSEVDQQAYQINQKAIADQLQLEKEKATPDEKVITGYQTQLKQNEIAEKDRLASLKDAGIRQEAESKIADLRGGTADKSAKAYEIEKKELTERMAAEKTREHPDEQALKAMEIEGKRIDQQEQERRRDQDVTRKGADLELGARRARREGRTEEAVALRDQKDFLDRYERYRESLGEAEAKQRAGAEAEEDIKSSVIPGGPAAVASSLQKIGGGGGAYGPTGDPGQSVQKRIAALAQSSNQYLREIAGKGDGVQ